MRFATILALFLISNGAMAHGADIDLTARDLYVRPGFDKSCLTLPLSGDAPGWHKVPGKPGNRPVRVRDLGLPGVPRFRHLSLTRYSTMEFTFMTSFDLNRAMYDSGNLALYLAQIGLNWQVYVNGTLVRDEMHLAADGSIERERAMRGVLMELDRRYLREGTNVLAFRIIGTPTDDRTGFFMKDTYLVGDYAGLQKRFHSEYIDLVLIALYFFVSIFYLLLYILRRKEQYTLFFGLGTICFALTMLCRTKQIFNMIDDTSIIQYAQFFSMFLGMPLFGAFIDSLLRQKISTFSRFYLVLCFVLCIAIPLPVLETAHRIWQIMAPIALLYMLVYDVIMLSPSEFIRYYRDTRGTGALRILKSAIFTLLRSIPGNLLIGFCVVLGCLIVDIRNGNAGIPTAYSQYGFFFMMMGITAILVNQYITVYNRLDLYSASLKQEIEGHKRSEEDLRYTRNYLRNVFNSLPSMLVSIDEEGMVTQCNNAGEVLCGVPLSQMAGQPLCRIQPFQEEDAPVFRDIMESGKPHEMYRTHIFSGENRSFRIALMPLSINGTRGAVIRVDDITEMERKEIQLRQAQKMEIIGNLAGGLAHDFNNVLGGILGMASLLNLSLKKKNFDPQELSEGIDLIIHSVKRAANMVMQLLAISRRQELTLTSVDLNLAIKHVQDICNSTIDKSIDINVTLHNGQPVVLADSTQIEQVLLNLCVNASHAMTIMRPEHEPQGGVLTLTVGLATADQYFCQTHPEAAPGEYWRVTVSDTGVGMDSKTIAKIFDPFFTTKDKGLGTGLGLAMANSIIQQHKGFIDVYSEKGVGTSFNVFIPRHIHQGVVPEHRGRPGEIAKGRGTIMVIDDEDVIRDITKKMLMECGYTVILASNGMEGLQIFKERQAGISAVILDMAMPRMSGRETYIEMKRISPAVKVLIASGFKFDQRVQDVMELGANAFIHKPYTLDELASKVRDVLEER